MSSKKVGRRVVGGRASVLLAAAAVVWPVAARAQTYTGGAGVGNWSVPTNWNSAAVPGAGASVTFWNNDDLGRTLNYDYAGPAVTLGTFLIDQPGTGSNTFQMVGQALSTRSTYVGSYGSATFNQSGGVHATDGLSLGWQPQSRSQYTLSGGELRPLSSSSGGSELIGFGGVGVFEHTGGTNTTATLLVGFQDTSAPNPDGSGTYRMSGSARLQVTSFEAVGEYGSGAGLFEQSGGTHVAVGLIIGNNLVGRGTYRLSGDGSLTTNLYEAVEQNGTFEQTGGTHTVNAGLSVVGSTAAPAAYSLSAGALTGMGLGVGGSSGTSAGTVNISGGTATLSGKVTVGRGGGVLNLSGGSLKAGTLQNDGAVNASGGTFAGAVVNTGTLRVGGSAAFTVTGSVVGDSGGTAVGRLALDAGGGLVASSVYQESLEMNGSTANPPAPGPVLSIRKKADGGKTSLVRALSIPSDETGKPVGRVDLADTALVVDYAQTSPIDSVRTLIGAAYAGGTWAGNGLGSSVAANTPGRGLGYREASDMLGASGGTFAGQAVDGTAVLVQYTVMGDATLNGQVNFEDLLALARHYNATGATWGDGDFNYDGVVDFADLLTLARNYNTALPTGPVPGAPAEFSADLAAAFAAAVPEPAGLGMGLSGAAMAASLRRRTRRQIPRRVLAGQ